MLEQVLSFYLNSEGEIVHQVSRPAEQLSSCERRKLGYVDRRGEMRCEEGSFLGRTTIWLPTPRTCEVPSLFQVPSAELFEEPRYIDLPLGEGGSAKARFREIAALVASLPELAHNATMQRLERGEVFVSTKPYSPSLERIEKIYRRQRVKAYFELHYQEWHRQCEKDQDPRRSQSWINAGARFQNDFTLNLDKTMASKEYRLQGYQLPHLIDLSSFFHQLVRLDLSSNCLQDLPPLPSQLEQLLLGNNQLKRVPARVLELRSLKVLDLSHNPLEEYGWIDLAPREALSAAQKSRCMSLPWEKLILDATSFFPTRFLLSCLAPSLSQLSLRKSALCLDTLASVLTDQNRPKVEIVLPEATPYYRLMKHCWDQLIVSYRLEGREDEEGGGGESDPFPLSSREFATLHSCCGFSSWFDVIWRALSLRPLEENSLRPLLENLSFLARSSPPSFYFDQNFAPLEQLLLLCEIDLTRRFDRIDPSQFFDPRELDALQNPLLVKQKIFAAKLFSYLRGVAFLRALGKYLEAFLTPEQKETQPLEEYVALLGALFKRFDYNTACLFFAPFAGKSALLPGTEFWEEQFIQNLESPKNWGAYISALPLSSYPRKLLQQYYVQLGLPALETSQVTEAIEQIGGFLGETWCLLR